MGELFKYYLLIKRAYRISKVHFFSDFFALRPSIMNQMKDLDKLKQVFYEYLVISLLLKRSKVDKTQQRWLPRSIFESFFSLFFVAFDALKNIFDTV